MSRTITICGSVTNTPREIWDAHAQKLTLEGNLVFAVNVWGLRDWLHNDEIGIQQKEILDRVHKLKIARSDEVHVLRKDGYIGTSTRGEIEFAQYLQIPVKYIDCDVSKQTINEVKE